MEAHSFSSHCRNCPVGVSFAILLMSPNLMRAMSPLQFIKVTGDLELAHAPASGCRILFHCSGGGTLHEAPETSYCAPAVTH